MAELNRCVVKVRIIECETYSRVVGYYRPVQNWNVGKKAEFKERKFLKNRPLNRGEILG